MNRPLVRHLVALAVAAMGTIDLLSAYLSHPSDRLLAVRRLIPTEVIDTSRTFTLLAGALLLVTAWGLRRGKRRAYVTALFLCAVSVPFNLLKAFDFEEATLAASLMFVLGVSAEAFGVRSRELSLRALRSPALLALLGLLVYAVLGCWFIGTRYGHGVTLNGAMTEAGYRLFGVGDSVIVLPRGLTHVEHRVASWFLDSLSVIGITLLTTLALLALRPVQHRGRHRAETADVAGLVRRYGDNSVAAFALAPDSDYFFSPNRRAVIAYRFESDTLLVIGDPIGPAEEIPPLLVSFERHCREHDWQFAFFQARPELLPAYRRCGWRALHIGEDPLLWTDRFTLEGSSVGELRRMVRKLDRQGLEARMFLPDENPFDPENDPDGLLEQMRDISAEWLRSRHGGEKGFCMGRFDPHALNDVWLSVAWNPAARRVEAFCTFVPVWGRRGWTLDLMRRHADSLSGSTEFLVVKSVERARQRGDAMISLSLSALAKVADEPAPTAPGTEPAAAAPASDAAADDRGRQFLMDALARYYDFKNLFRWKKKFNPVFEDRYLVYPETLALPRVARALLRAQTPAGLLSYLRGTR
ncbi:MAG TPA: phosphatidylglycerol lysyltransferase domain-containing protein [Candidatus Saccharimonadaceae bacterium]|jgi:phosphatidylglycerol lysyltransferase|nr:phosphatidylglycerol lysyltransferase domain-containing protein [Candidatus Saccharimonadaceae bacterium]